MESPAKFVEEVRREVAKVTWPSRKETMITTMMVFAFVVLAAIFFFFVDQVMSLLVKSILGLGA
jgi:preprotein translocase subunit SecE